MPSDFRITDPIDFEKHVAVLLQAQGYEVIMPEANTRGYDLEVVDGKERVAVQIKNHKARSNISQILQFVDFLELPLASKFTSGWFLSASGFSRPALTHIETERPSNLRLGLVEGSVIDWAYDPDGSSGLARPDAPTVRATPKSQRNAKYFGVFTCKGGVGKTTVAAHLAGAFALQGYDVILLDLDPDKNLRKLFMEDPNEEDETASLYVPPPKKAKRALS